jgi:SAM-dependent methyltransferase
MRAEEQHDFASLGASYFWLAGRRQLAMELLRHHMGPPASPQLVLDNGCGPGHEIAELSRLGPVIGCDLSFDALKLCREQGRAVGRVACANGERLPFQSERFDVVILHDVLEHMEHDAEALRECRRILKPGGWLVISVPAFRWLWGAHDDKYGHLRRYTAGQLRQLVGEASLTAAMLSYVQWLYVLPLWLMRNAKRLIPGLSRRDDFLRVPGWLNALLTWTIRVEAAWLRHGALPWGASVLCIARRP